MKPQTAERLKPALTDKRFDKALFQPQAKAVDASRSWWSFFPLLLIGIMLMTTGGRTMAVSATQLATLDVDGEDSPRSPYYFPEHITAVNGTAFFVQEDPFYGRELWTSDGTQAGTVIVRDIELGSGSSFPYQLTNVNGTLFFSAGTDTAGYELWKSDGTEAGTVMVRDIVPGSGSSFPYQLTNVNGTLFFSARTDSEGYELWKSDGTEDGTVMIRDIEPGTFGSLEYNDPIHSVPANFTNVNGTLFFSANTSNEGRELWKSDGTEAGTVMVRDIEPGPGSSMRTTDSFFKVTFNFTNVNGTLFFTAYTSSESFELWKSDGTEAGTVMVRDIELGSGPYGYGSYPNNLTNINGTLFFSAYTANEGEELWKSDGTEAGTVMVRDIEPGPDGSIKHNDPFYDVTFNFANVNGTLFFTAYTSNEELELWKSDGTETGTVMVRDIELGPNGSYPHNLTNINDTLFFSARTDSEGYELWKSNGTEAGTVMVRDINPGPDDSIKYQFPDPFSDIKLNFANINGTLFFTVHTYTDPGIDEFKLWKSDGTEAGTTQLYNNNKTRAQSHGLLINGTYFFIKYTETQGEELWKSDGTVAGTVLIRDIEPGPGGSHPEHLTDVNGTLFFSASTTNEGFELWKSDGTEAGTVMVRDIEPGPSDSIYVGRYEKTFANVNGTLFFVASTSSEGFELWKSDGTRAGTVLVRDIRPGPNGSYLRELTNVNGTLFFNAYGHFGGEELWKSDGTEAGTMLVKDIYPVHHSSPKELTNVNGTLFFSADTSTEGYELWKSDGSEAGTVLVRDIAPGPGHSYPEELTNVNGTLFFSAYISNGRELWKSDGTEAGTILVRKIEPRPDSSSPEELTNLNGTLFFTADTSNEGRELWKSDGTEAGTVLVRDIYAGLSSSGTDHLITANDMLYFTATNTAEGTELWVTDGSEAGTKPLSLVEGGSHINPIISAVGDSGLFVDTHENFSNSALYYISLTTPIDLIFDDATDAIQSSVITSNTLNISGLNLDADITITNGEYSLNSAPFTSAPGTASNGDTLQLRTTSSASYNTTADVVVSIGDGGDTWSVTTLTDTVPDAFSFTDQDKATLSTLISSDAIIITGLGASSPISISGGEYSINGGAYTSVDGLINNNDNVSLRTTSSTSWTTPVDAVLNIGGVSDIFSVTTDADTDTDGVGDSVDAFPADPTETTDTDGDGVGNNTDADDDNDAYEDVLDNCILAANNTQLDTDNDGYGNACDADFNNDNIVNTLDLGVFKTAFFLSGSQVTDLNGDGIVNSLDLGTFKQQFFKTPGPSGLNP